MHLHFGCHLCYFSPMIQALNQVIQALNQDELTRCLSCCSRQPRGSAADCLLQQQATAWRKKQQPINTDAEQPQIPRLHCQPTYTGCGGTGICLRKGDLLAIREFGNMGRSKPMDIRVEDPNLSRCGDPNLSNTGDVLGSDDPIDDRDGKAL